VNLPHLFDAWEELVPRLRRPRQVALFSDFDGTLAPIRSHPGHAQIPAGTRRILAACAKQVGLVGFISGRTLEDIRRRVGVPGAWYVGVHGYSILSSRRRRFLRLKESQRQRIAEATRYLAKSLAKETGIRVEAKEAAVAVHYRGAPAGSRHKASRVVHSVAAESPGLRLLAGRKVWEIMPDEKVDKASAIRFILRRERIRPALVFLGDDVTDESVFRWMRGVTVLVGKRRPTAARYWLRSPEEVREFLERCLALWK
jgi:trehalose-phosphatase